MKVSKDIPLAEITLRKYEKPYDLDRRELTKKLCLSIGLLQPGDSRDVVVDVLYVILQNKLLDSREIEDKVIELRKSYNLELKGIASSNIRRQIKRLKDLFLIENVNNKYRINENEPLINIFEEKIEKFYIKSIIDRVKEYFRIIKP
ncbi:hypothetical protein J4446_03675 [Candidatus Woesearchaeota archaeon]|nr:hypothetical protein [Candidatus Woesearchaeota archaeon]